MTSPGGAAHEPPGGGRTTPPFVRTGQTVDFIHRIRTTEQALWRALTTREGLASWLGCVDAYVGDRPGDDFYLRWRTCGVAIGRTEFGYHGAVLAYQRHRYLALEYHGTETEHPTYLSLEARPSSSVRCATTQITDIDLRLIHSGFAETGPDAFSFDGHSRQWRQTVGNLAARLEGRPARVPESFLGVMFIGGIPGTGLLIRDVVTNSPAHRAQVRAGDVLSAVNGHPVGTLDDFHDWLDLQPAGTTNAYTFLDRTVEITSEDADHMRRRLTVAPG